MEVVGLKNQIQTRDISPFYIFIGIEWAVQKIYIEQIAKVSKKQIQYADDVLTVYRNCQNKSLVKTSNLYVVLDDEEYAKEEKLQARIKEVLKDDILILVYTKADKRKKIFKDAVEFEPLKPEVLKKYLQRESISLANYNWNVLIDICEGDYGRCLLEIDKVKRYCQYVWEKKHENFIDDDIVFENLLKDGTIHIPEKDSTFDFIDAVLRRQVERAFELKPKDNIMGTLQLLYNNAKAVLAIQLCKGKDVTKTSGIDSRQIYFAREKTGKYYSKELIRMLKLIQQMQEGIVTGQIEEQFVLDYLLVNVL